MILRGVTSQDLGIVLKLKCIPDNSFHNEDRHIVDLGVDGVWPVEDIDMSVRLKLYYTRCVAECSG
ncbi:hypothetical protein HanIR_Chr08g0378511 [Helianthus annuus]|nr:hypothetical protein HanIR_Chr08g0378511 [Helianthus annuus]